MIIKNHVMLAKEFLKKREIKRTRDSGTEPSTYGNLVFLVFNVSGIVDQRGKVSLSINASGIMDI